MFYFTFYKGIILIYFQHYLMTFNYVVLIFLEVFKFISISNYQLFKFMEIILIILLDVIIVLELKYFQIIYLHF